jgi:hypothetical protein
MRRVTLILKIMNPILVMNTYSTLGVPQETEVTDFMSYLFGSWTF